MCRRSAAVAVKHGDSLRKLVSLGSPRIYTLFVDMESASSPYTLTVHWSVWWWYDIWTTGCQMVLRVCILQGQCDEWQSKWISKLLYDMSVLHLLRYLFRQMWNFAVYVVCSGFMLSHCAAYCGVCVSVLLSLCHMGGLCNGQHQDGKSDDLSHFSTVLWRSETAHCIESLLVIRQGSIISRLPVSDQHWSWDSLAYP